MTAGGIRDQGSKLQASIALGEAAVCLLQGLGPAYLHLAHHVSIFVLLNEKIENFVVPIPKLYSIINLKSFTNVCSGEVAVCVFPVVNGCGKESNLLSPLWRSQVRRCGPCQVLSPAPWALSGPESGTVGPVGSRVRRCGPCRVLSPAPWALSGPESGAVGPVGSRVHGSTS